MLDSVAAGDGACVVVRGEAGVGKSALLDRLAVMALDHDHRVWHVKADEVASARSFDPWLRIGTLGPGERPIGRVDDGPTHDRVIELAQAAAATAPLTIVLDDLQWADPDTARTLPLIVRDLVDHRVVVAIGVRPWPHEPHVDEMLRRLDGLGATALELGPLDIADLVDLAEERLGAAPDRDLVVALAGAGGNPFLAGTIVDLSTRPDDSGADAHRSAVDRLVAALPADTVEVLGHAAVFGASFGLASVAALAGRPVEEVWTATEPARTAGVLRPVGDHHAFSHDLVRASLYDDLPIDVRAARHRRAAGLLLDRGAEPSTVVRHLVIALEGGVDDTVPLLIETAERIRFDSPESAVEMMRRLRTSRRLDEPQRLRVDELLAEGCVFSGRLGEAEAIARARLIETTPEPARSRFGFTLASTLFLSGKLQESADRFTELYRNGDPRGVDRGVAGVDAALARLTASDLATATDLCEVVLDGASSAAALAYAHGVRGLLHALDGDTATGVETATRGVAIAEAVDDPEVFRNTPHYFLAQVQVWADQHDAARATVVAGRERSALLGLGWHEPMFHLAHAESMLRCADVDAARALAEAGLRYSDDHGAHIEDARLHSIVAEAALLQGDLETAEAHLDQCDRRQRANGGHGADRLFSVRSQLDRRHGDDAAALAGLDLLWQSLDALGAHLPMWEIAPMLVEVLVAEGQDDAAMAIVGRLEVLRHQPRPWVLTWCRALVGADTTVLRRVRDERDRASGGDLDARHLDHQLAALDGTVEIAEASTARSWRDLLTPTEIRVVEGVAAGSTNAQIAEALFVSRRTVESHLYRTYQKLHVRNRVELTILASK